MTPEEHARACTLFGGLPPSKENPQTQKKVVRVPMDAEALREKFARKNRKK